MNPRRIESKDSDGPSDIRISCEMKSPLLLPMNSTSIIIRHERKM